MNNSLESIINEFAEKICKHRGFKTPYEIILKSELPRDSKDRDRIIIIKADGSVPKVFISQLYIMACVVNKSKEANIPILKETIERALEFLPKMQHTLSLVPIAEAVALRNDSKRWYRANIPSLAKDYDEKWLKYEYSVTVTDSITNTSVTKHGDDINELKFNAKRDLIKLVQESEELEDLRDIMEDVHRVKSLEIKPNEISIIVDGSNTETRMEY